MPEDAAPDPAADAAAANPSNTSSPGEADLPVDRDRSNTEQNQKDMAAVAAAIDAGGGEIPEIMCVG